MKDEKMKFIKYFLELALPVAFQQLLVNIVSITDTIMVGGISEEAISATTVANKYFFIYNLAIFGLTNAVGLFLSQYYGAKDRENCNKVLRFGMRCVTMLSLLTMGVLIIEPELVLKVFVSKKIIIELGRSYNDIVRYSYLFYGWNQMLAIAYRVEGNSRHPLYASITSVIVNIILNYILIFGKLGIPMLGVQGAALATTISRIVEFIILAWILLQKKEFYYIHNSFGVLSKDQKITIIRKSLPLIANETIWATSLSIIFMNYCKVNESFIPSLTIVDQVANLSYVVFAGFASAVGIIIGNTLGADDLSKAKRLSKVMILVGLMINIIMSVLIACCSYVIPSIYSLGEISTKIATRLILIKCAVMWTQGYSETIYYILRAGGDTKSVFFIDGFFMICGPVAMSILFTSVLNVNLYIVYCFVEGISVLKIFVSTYFYKKETWLKNLTIQS